MANAGAKDGLLSIILPKLDKTRQTKLKVKAGKAALLYAAYCCVTVPDSSLVVLLVRLHSSLARACT